MHILELRIRFYLLLMYVFQKQERERIQQEELEYLRQR